MQDIHKQMLEYLYREENKLPLWDDCSRVRVHHFINCFFEGCSDSSIPHHVAERSKEENEHNAALTRIFKRLNKKHKQLLKNSSE